MELLSIEKILMSQQLTSYVNKNNTKPKNKCKGVQQSSDFSHADYFNAFAEILNSLRKFVCFLLWLSWCPEAYTSFAYCITQNWQHRDYSLSSESVSKHYKRPAMKISYWGLVHWSQRWVSLPSISLHSNMVYKKDWQLSICYFESSSLSFNTVMIYLSNTEIEPFSWI